jgi:chemotaxis signal transduction protein
MTQPRNMPVVAGQVQPEGENQFLTFLLSGEMFAIGIRNIKEITEYAK